MFKLPGSHEQVITPHDAALPDARRHFMSAIASLPIAPDHARDIVRELDEAVGSLARGGPLSAVLVDLEDRYRSRFVDRPDIAEAVVNQAIRVLTSTHPLLAAHANGSEDTTEQPLLDTHPDTSPTGHESLLAALQAARSIGLCVVDPEDRIVAANNRLLEMLEMGEPPVIGQGGMVLLGAPRHILGEALESRTPGQRWAFESTVERADERRISLGVECVTVTNADGTLRYLLCLVQDLTVTRLYQQSRQAVEERVHALFHQTSEVVGIIGDDGELLYVSDSIERILGYRPDDVIGHRFFETIAVAGEVQGLDIVQRVAAKSGASATLQLRVRHADGSTRWMESNVANMSHVPAIGGLVITAHDVTDRRSFEQQLERLAYFDTLTALPNRAQFRERLDEAVAHANATGETVGVVFIDLDRFKMINDRFGHDTGDSALVTAGERIVQVLEPGQMVARLGGDEFAILVQQTSAEHALEVANRVLARLACTIPDHQQTFPVEATGGVAVSSADLASPSELLRAADIALYHGKGLGGGVATMFTPSMYAAAYQRAELERSLQRALERHEMVPYFQPEYDLATGDLLGLEVLMRWRRAGGKLTQPPEFMQVAIDTGIIIPLGLDLLRQACTHTVRWNASRPDAPPVAISFNVSTREIPQPGYAARLGEVLDDTGLDPDLLSIEIDEAAFRDARPDLDRFVQAVRALGVHVVLDRFGGGHASLPQIQRLRPDRFKIAPEAVSGSGSRRIDVAILNTVTTIAAVLDVPVTAVGIVDEEHLQQAREAGCHRAQCTLLSPPVPASKVPALLAAGKVRLDPA